MGMTVIRGLIPSSPNVWTGGTIYNPDDGETYGARVTVVEEYRGESESFTNGVTDVHVAEEGALDRVRIHAEDPRAQLVAGVRHYNQMITGQTERLQHGATLRLGGSLLHQTLTLVQFTG